MAKAIHHGKSHGVWVLPCYGLCHGSMAKAMDIVKGDIYGFCHVPLLHGSCHASFKQKTHSHLPRLTLVIANCNFTQPGIFCKIAAFTLPPHHHHHIGGCQMLIFTLEIFISPQSERSKRGDFLFLQEVSKWLLWWVSKRLLWSYIISIRYGRWRPNFGYSGHTFWR